MTLDDLTEAWFAAAKQEVAESGPLYAERLAALPPERAIEVANLARVIIRQNFEATVRRAEAPHR